MPALPTLRLKLGKLFVLGIWCALLPQIILAAPRTEDFESGNFNSYPWQRFHNDTDFQWQVIPSQPYEGTYCAWVGNTGGSSLQVADLYVTLDCAAGNVSFWYKASFTPGAGVVFYIDGEAQGTLPETYSSYVQKTYAVTAGVHTFKWNVGHASTNDAYCSLDYIQFPPVPDTTAPTVTNLSPTAGATVVFSTVDMDVTFSEAVMGVDASDLELGGTAAGGATVGTPVDQGGNTWRFPVSGLVSGTLEIDLAPDVNDIEDLAGNDVEPRPTEWSYTVSLETTPPEVTGLNPTNGATVTSEYVHVEVTFSETVQGVDASDLELAGAAAVSATVNAPIQLSTNRWRFPITNLVNGSLEIDLAPDPNDIEDLVGNDLAPQPTEWSYTVMDQNAPVVSSILPGPGTVIVNYEENVLITFSETVQGVDASDLVLSGAAAVGTTVGEPIDLGSNIWRFPVFGLANGTLEIDLAPDANDIEDRAGNDLTPRPTEWSYTVEYLLLIVSNQHAVTYLRTGHEQFIDHPIDSLPSTVYSMHAADLDGDGDQDVLGALYFADQIKWWKNLDGNGTTWAEYTVDSLFDGAYSVHSTDVDRDGDMDVLGAAYNADEVAWWENQDGRGTNWAEHLLSDDFDGVRSVYSVDVDDDGDMDILGAASGAKDITWWENLNGSGTIWTEHVIDGNYGALTVFSADVDGDGDLDVLGGENFDITWWENIDGTGTNWSAHAVGDYTADASSLYSADMDGDGDMDVLSSDSHDITWWENVDGDGLNWDDCTVDFGDWDGASAIYSIDIDGDGDLDVLGAVNTEDDFTWWENRNGSGTSWSKHTIHADYIGARAVCPSDVDGDGDLDVLGGGLLDITCWKNDSEFLGTFYPPAWSNILGETTNLIAFLSNSVEGCSSSTQLVSAGWGRTGSDPGEGSGPNTGPFAFTNETVVQFNWTTNVIFQYSTNWHGEVTGDAPGWYPLGGTVAVTAAPHMYYSWSGWTGDVDMAVNPLTLTNDRAWRIWPVASENLAIHDTPEWWLALFGWTNNFDAAALDDYDGDGVPTWQEFPAGTIPTNILSVFQATSVESYPASGYRVIRWASESNRVYTLYRSTNLLADFDTVTNDIPATPPVNVCTDSVGSLINAYYSIGVQEQ